MCGSGSGGAPSPPSPGRSVLGDHTKKRTRRACAFNAFLKQKMRGRKLRVGSEEHKSLQATLSQEWKGLSASDRQPYEAQAHLETAAKSEVAGLLLREKAGGGEADMLTPAQIKRLGQCRLDKSVDAAVNHELWSHGLQLASHVSALRPGLVRDIGVAAARAEIEEAFQYDPEPLVLDYGVFSPEPFFVLPLPKLPLEKLPRTP